jgi:hypothetical protein
LQSRFEVDRKEESKAQRGGEKGGLETLTKKEISKQQKRRRGRMERYDEARK